jgi:hypothetical protein
MPQLYGTIAWKMMLAHNAINHYRPVWSDDEFFEWARVGGGGVSQEIDAMMAEFRANMRRRK